MFKLFHATDQEFLIPKQAIYKSKCMFCRCHIEKNEGNTLFWNDYVTAFNVYGIILSTQSRYCNLCINQMNWILQVLFIFIFMFMFMFMFMLDSYLHMFVRDI